MYFNDDSEAMRFDGTDLTANMEDYLETISILLRENRVVRVKDIAKSLKVKMPSVSAALQKLSEKGLIIYEKYGYVDLTEEGKKIADKVYSRHACLTDFFHNILRIDAKTAEEEACRVEHHLSPEACRKIHRLVQYMGSRESEGPWKDKFIAMMEEIPLSDASEGSHVVIVRLDAQGILKKRLMELGFRKGETLKLVRYAPLQDPLQVRIKGYDISLRVEEAGTVIVRTVKNERR